MTSPVDTASPPSVEAPESVPEWAKVRARELVGNDRAFAAFARYIAEVSNAASQVFDQFSDGAQHDVRVAPLAPFIQPEPADPLERILEDEARKLAERWCGPGRMTDAVFCQALIALKRGIELGQAK